MKMIKGGPAGPEGYHPITVMEVPDGHDAPMMGLTQDGRHFAAVSAVGMFTFDVEAGELIADYLVRLAGFIRHNAVDYTGVAPVRRCPTCSSADRDRNINHRSGVPFACADVWHKAG